MLPLIVYINKQNDDLWIFCLPYVSDESCLTQKELFMEFILISCVLLAGMATVDIRETRSDPEDDLDSVSDRPYGVHG